MLAPGFTHREPGLVRKSRANLHLDIGRLDHAHARGARRKEVRGSYEGSDNTDYRCEEPEGVLDADEG